MVEIKLIKLNSDLDFQSKYMKYISLERRVKILKYKNIDDKKRSLISELLIRNTFNEKFNIPVDKIKIDYNPYGKPYIDNVRFFKFNISHSGKYVAIATSKYKIGIDIEYIKDIDIMIAKRCFTKREYEYIEGYKDGLERLKAFYKLWTLKESYIKSEGKGLKIILNSFGIDADKNILLSENKSNYKFYNEMIENYILSVCFQSKEKIKEPIEFMDENELYNKIV